MAKNKRIKKHTEVAVPPTDADISDTYFTDLVQNLHVQGEPAQEKNLVQSEAGRIADILQQRHDHRTWIFKFAVWLTVFSIGLFTLIVIAQSFMRIFINADFELLGAHGLEVVAVSVFGQSLGVIIIIAKSIWDDTPYKDILRD